MIKNLNLDDKWRKEAVERKKQAVTKEKPPAKKEREAPAKAKEEKKESLIPPISLALGQYAYYKNSFNNAAASFSESSEASKGEAKEQAMFWLGKALSQFDKNKARD
jgi:uncharacterized protein HemY